MHDPQTIAFEIRYPWRRYSRRDRTAPDLTKFEKEWRSSYRDSFITIWHVDPEIKGNDDSCGWFTPPFSQITKEICHQLATDEAREPWFMARGEQSLSDPILCERLLFGAFILVSRCLVNRGVIRRRVSVGNAMRWAAEGTHNSVDNFRSSLCFLSGYHSNWYKPGTPNTIEEDKFWREQQAETFFRTIAGWILRDQRRWYSKPRWHFYHWKFQIHPLQAMKRWLFTRCCGCGKRFAYGGSPVSMSWNGDGPRWFRSETHVYHDGCCPPMRVPEPSTASGIEK